MRVLFGLLLFLGINTAFSQTVSLPDTNLRNKLIASYPQVMQGNQLDLLKAADLTGTLDLRNAHIKDAAGIEYFTGITTLNLSDNQLSTIPDISTTTGLVNFYASNNQLITLPDMSGLTQLTDFQVMNNQLTALPDLSGSTELRSLYCSNNKIIQLPPLTQFPDLTNLVIGDNPLQGPIDYSSCTNLIQLHIHKTGADTIVGLDKLHKLTTLFAWGNQIRDFSGLDSNSTLATCVIFDNPIKNLPFLENKPINELAIKNCNLTFEDIEPIIQQGAPASFTYSPQRPIPFGDQTARAENIYTLNYPINSPSPANIYVWMKDGAILDSSASPTRTFSPLAFSDSGNYVLKIYNTNIPGLIVKTDTFYLKVDPCIEFTIPFIDVIRKECVKGYTIDLSNAQIKGGNTPFTYELDNGVFKKKFSNVVIENLPAGKYKITLIDSHKCSATNNFVLNRIERCDPILTPNGDGIADSYFIEKSGTVKIYDLKRRLINTLQAPVAWDGTDRSGVLVDAGYYILILENEPPIYITLVR